MAKEPEFTPIKPGTVHFEFGAHLSKQDAIRRLRQHLETDPPEHFVVENYPFPYGGAISIWKLRRALLEQHHRSKYIIERSSAGRMEMTREDEEAFPYAAKRTRMVVAINTTRPGKIQAHCEPFGEEHVLEQQKLLEDHLPLTDAIREGNFEKADRAYQVVAEQFTKLQVIRERGIVELLVKLHRDNPKAKILCDMGGSHGHLVDLLRKQGVPVSARESDADKLAADEQFRKRLAQVHHGLPVQKWTAEEQQEAYRRAMLSGLLVTTGAVTRDAKNDAIRTLNTQDLNTLFDELRKPGRDLGLRAYRWLKEHHHI